MTIAECYQCGTPAELNYRSRCEECQYDFESAHFKVIVAGGRGFHDYNLMKAKLDRLLSNKSNVMIISGTAKGADQLGERYAKEMELELLQMPAHWDQEGKAAGYRRNERMARRADACVCFWDGESRGTKHMMDIAEREGLLLRTVRYDA